MNVLIANFEPPFCKGGGYHIRTGDLCIRVQTSLEYYVYDYYCFSCAVDLNDQKMLKMCERANNNNVFLQKRQAMLDKYSKHKQQIVGLVAWNWKTVEVNEAVQKIRYESFAETWLQRLGRLFEELNKSNPFTEIPKKKKGKKINK